MSELFIQEAASFNFMAAVTICSNFGAQENKVSHCFHCFPIYVQWSDGTRCHIYWLPSIYLTIWSAHHVWPASHPHLSPLPHADTLFIPLGSHTLCQNISCMDALLPCMGFETQENKICHCFHFFPIYLPWSDGTDGLDAMINIGQMMNEEIINSTFPKSADKERIMLTPWSIQLFLSTISWQLY